MTILITKTPFYVRPVGPDGTARQEFVRLQPGAVLRQMGQRWCTPMSYHAPGKMHLCYRVDIDSGVDDEGNDWSGRGAYASADRFTTALVSSKMTPELETELAPLDVSSLVR